MGFGRKQFCGRAAANEFLRISVFSGQSLTRSAPAPFAQGSHGLMQNSAFCRSESRGKSKSFKTEYGRKTQVAHSPSVAPRQLPLGGSHESVRFSALCRRENKHRIRVFKIFKRKNLHTFPFAAVQCVNMSLPPGGRCHAQA